MPQLSGLLWEYLPPLLILAVALGVGALVYRWSKFYQDEVSEISHTRVQTLDGLRGFLAVGVAIYHYALHYATVTQAGAATDVKLFHRALGSFSVTLFFAITGYLFWGKAVAGKVRWWPHLRSRFFRIAPLYWFAAVAVVVIAVVSTGPPQPGRGAEAAEGIARVAALGIVRAGGGSPDREATYNGLSLYRLNSVVWTLHFEWLFYFALPVLAWFRKPAAFAALVGIYGILAVLRVPYFPRSPYYAAFVVGMATVYLVRSVPLCALLRRPIMGIAAVLALVAASRLSVAESTLYVFASIGMAFVAFLIFAGGNTLFGLLTLPGAKTIGAASYSIYLLHMPLMSVTGPLLNRLPAGRAVGQPGGAFWAWSALFMVITTGIALATYRLIERPFIDLERSFRKRRDAHAPRPPGLETAAESAEIAAAEAPRGSA